MPEITDVKLHEELDMDKGAILKDKFKTTDSIKKTAKIEVNFLKADFDFLFIIIYFFLQRNTEDYLKEITYDDLKQQNQDLISKKLKADLNELAWSVKQKSILNDTKRNEPSEILMVIIKNYLFIIYLHMCDI